MAAPVFTSEEILSFLAKPEDHMESMFTKLNAIAGTHPTEKEHPTLIILGGSPGVGKSTFIKNEIADKRFGVTGNDYFVISHDNILENFKPFQDDIRAKLADIEITLPKATNVNIDANYAKIEPELESLSGTYLKYFGHNKHKFNDVRNLIFQEAVKRKFNIIYDTTYSAKDIISQYILPYLTGTTPYNEINVIHIYAKADTIVGHLNARHKAFMKTKNYLRAVPKKQVGRFLGLNKKGFEDIVRKHLNKEGFKFYEYDNSEYNGEYNGVLTPVTSAPPANNNARPNNTKKRGVPATPNNSSKTVGVKTQKARASSKKAVNMLGPVAPPKSKNANETAEVAVAATANVLPKPKRRAKPTAAVPVPVANVPVPKNEGEGLRRGTRIRRPAPPK